MSTILGVSAFYHDAAVCLVRDGEVLAAAQEERFTRRKFDPSLPVNAFHACLTEVGLTPRDIDMLAYYEDPRRKLSRILWSFGAGIGNLRSVLDTWSEKTALESVLRETFLFDGLVATFPHHYCHAASAYLFSPFEDAAILVADGVGEWAASSFASGSQGHITVLDEVVFPHSLGLFYSAITAFLGFQPNSDEYKVMGMASYGKPRYAEALRRLLRLGDHGRYTLDMTYLDYNRRMFSPAMEQLLGLSARERGDSIDQAHMDVARSAQELLEEAMLEAAGWLYEQIRAPYLCLAGGVALNCVANARILAEGPFKDVFVQPASGDAGGCLGAALAADQQLNGWRPRQARSCYLGPSYTAETIAAYIERMGIVAERLSPHELVERTAVLLASQKIVGWFQGRMELGPRALGARSILADPRRADMQDLLNDRIKKRESFRPFAPICLPEDAGTYFECDRPYPFMTFTVQVRRPELLPAAVHVDNSARLQTVDEQQAPLLAMLLRSFGQLTGTPILINTSFNVAGEPVVCSPQDAFNCFRESGMDTLVIGPFLVERERQDPTLIAPGSEPYLALAREIAPYLKDTYFFT
jgi:carbamoyltransferase